MIFEDAKVMIPSLKLNKYEFMNGVSTRVWSVDFGRKGESIISYFIYDKKEDKITYKGQIKL